VLLLGTAAGVKTIKRR